MPNTYQFGRLGRFYAAKEPSYGTAPAFAATDAIRHLELALNYSPKNRVDSEDRWAHPSILSRKTRRTSADWSAKGIFWPSGVLNTLPDHTDFIECAMGALNNTTAATTIASGAGVSGATLTSGTGMVVGRPILINVSTGSPVTGRVVRWLTTVAGAAVTWAPPLPQAPGVGDAVKTCVGYSLATALPASMRLGHYMTSVSKEGTGAVVNQFKVLLDANDEIRWEASGPMQDRLTAAQTEPGSQTYVGTVAPSGLTAGLRVGSGAYEFLKFALTIDNAMELDNVAAGTTKAQAFYRRNKRRVTVDINAMYSSDVTLMTAAEGVSDVVLLAQCGNVEGSIVALYAPAVELDVPSDPDDDETMEHAFKGVCKGVSGNDEVFLAVA